MNQTQEQIHQLNLQGLNRLTWFLAFFAVLAVLFLTLPA